MSSFDAIKALATADPSPTVILVKVVIIAGNATNAKIPTAAVSNTAHPTVLTISISLGDLIPISLTVVNSEKPCFTL